MERFRVVLLWLILAYASAAAKSCGRAVLFPPELRRPGKRFLGHVIQSVEAPSEVNCQITCFLENDCVSYTFGPSANGNGICNISSSDHVTYAQGLREGKGFVYQGMKNACTGISCPADTKCQSGFTEKGYRCWCNRTDGGYTGENCQDIDECAGDNSCHSYATCTNTVGSYSCSCNLGYTGDGVTCTELIAEHVGCFKDSHNRTMSERLGIFGPPHGVAKCLHLILSRGYSYFGVQNGGACRSSPTAHLTYGAQGPATKCVGGYGGPWANDVYRVVPAGP